MNTLEERVQQLEERQPAAAFQVEERAPVHVQRLEELRPRLGRIVRYRADRIDQYLEGKWGRPERLGVIGMTGSHEHQQVPSE